MYYGVWTGKEMPDKLHVLILGESHYNDREGNDTDKELHGSTSNVIDYYLIDSYAVGFFVRNLTLCKRLDQMICLIFVRGLCSAKGIVKVMLGCFGTTAK